MAARSRGAANGCERTGSLGLCSRGKVRRDRRAGVRHAARGARQDAGRTDQDAAQIVWHQGATEEERERKEASKERGEAGRHFRSNAGTCERGACESRAGASTQESSG